jgi:hypothetical protein
LSRHLALAAPGGVVTARSFLGPQRDIRGGAIISPITGAL